MTARVLLAIFDATYLIALASWVGSILFFSFGVAPVIFGALGAEAAARFVRTLFPRYYTWGVISSSVALPALICGPLAFPELRGPWVLPQALAIVANLTLMLYCGNTLTPAINRSRDAGADQADRFDRLHRRSVLLNGVSLAIGLALIATYAARKPTRSAGIVELSPTERAAYDREFAEALTEMAAEARSVEGSSAGSASSGARTHFDEADRRELRAILDRRFRPK